MSFITYFTVQYSVPYTASASSVAEPEPITVAPTFRLKTAAVINKQFSTKLIENVSQSIVKFFNSLLYLLAIFKEAFKAIMTTTTNLIHPPYLSSGLFLNVSRSANDTPQETLIFVI